MNRSNIVSRLIKEGFSPKTLLTFSDKQISTLHNRIVNENTKMIPKEKTPEIETAKKNKETFVAYEAELKGGQKNLDKNKNGKLDSQDFKMLRSKKSEVKEGKPSAGLSKDKKTEEIGKKGNGVKEVGKTAKKNGTKVQKAVAPATMSKKIKKEHVEVSNWVKTLAENKFHKFTSKGEIVDLIKNKLHEQEFGAKVKKGHNNIPEFMTYDSIVGAGTETETPVKPKVTPERKEPMRKTPFRPGPFEKTKPKAGLGETKEVETPVKPKVTPERKEPLRQKPFRPGPFEKTDPKAGLKNK
jgi:hypothetical protein